MSGVVIAWLTNELSTVKRRPLPGAITGKPLKLGGLRGRNAATGDGALLCLEALRSRLQRGDGVTIASQGYGNAVRVFADRAAQVAFKSPAPGFLETP